MKPLVEDHIQIVQRHRIEDDDSVIGRHRDHVDHGVVWHLDAPHQALVLQGGPEAPQLQVEAGERAHGEDVQRGRLAHLAAPVGSAAERQATLRQKVELFNSRKFNCGAVTHISRVDSSYAEFESFRAHREKIPLFLSC
jgi:hypothetical protein